MRNLNATIYNQYLQSLEEESVQVGVVVLHGRDYVIHFVNPVILRLWGRTKKQVINKPLEEALPEIKGQGFKELLDGVYKTGKPFVGNELLIQLDVNNDGIPVDTYFNFVYQPSYNAMGKVDGILVHAVEVSDLVQARKKAVEGEIRFKTLIEKSTDAIQLVSPDGEILYTSDSIKNVLGYAAEELKGQGIAPFIHPDDLSYFNEKLQKLVKTPTKQITLEYRVKHKDGTWAWLETTGVNHLKTNNINALVGTFRNITQQKKTEKRIRYLAKASKIFSSSLDLQTIYRDITKLAIEEVADWCVVDMLNEQGALDMVAIAHKDSKKVTFIKEYRKVHPIEMNTMFGLPEIIKTRNSEFILKNTDQLLVSTSGTKRDLDVIRKLSVTSAMSVPLLVRGKAIGAITFVTTETEKRLTEDDLKIGEELADRASIAIENAKLYQEAKTVDEVQKRLAAVVESSDDAIISKSIDGTILTWNKGAEQLYGYKAEEIIGKPVSILMPYEKKDDFPMIMSRLKQGEKVEHYETKRKTKNGRILDVSLTVSPIRDVNGKIIGASKVARDITERKQAEERQKFLEQVSNILGSSIEYEKTLKSLGKLIVPLVADYCRIVVLDENKQIKEITVNHVNPKNISLVKELYNSYKDDTANTAGVEKLIQTGKTELMSNMTPKVLANSSPKVLELVKKLHLQSYMGVPMKIGNRIIGAITFSLTRTDRIYKAEDVIFAQELARRAAFAIENAKLYADSQKAVTIRDEFISVASHELKTPVTSLKMYVQVTKKQAEDNGEDTRNLEKMDVQINKLIMLIQDLLNVSKFQIGKLDYHDNEFDLQELVNETVDTIQQVTAKHTIKIDGSLKRHVWGDKDRIGQVIANLLTNAIKYSPKADKIHVRLTPEKECAVITVQDFGIGIDKQHQGKLFERFYRVNDPEEKTFPGLGLGLYISNEIVKRYGGQMSVVSSKGKGSLFSFTLPFNQIVMEKSNSISQKSVSL